MSGVINLTKGTHIEMIIYRGNSAIVAKSIFDGLKRGESYPLGGTEHNLLVSGIHIDKHEKPMNPFEPEFVITIRGEIE